jgi:hypothetical protein
VNTQNLGFDLGTDFLVVLFKAAFVFYVIGLGVSMTTPGLMV